VINNYNQLIFINHFYLLLIICKFVTYIYIYESSLNKRVGLYTSGFTSFSRVESSRVYTSLHGLIIKPNFRVHE
jgi:hypothetical protein